MAAKGTFLHHPFRSDGDISIEGTFHFLWPFGWIPVKVFDGVRTGSGAVPTADASVIDLSHEALFIDVGSEDGADLGAGRIVAMHAGPWKKPNSNMRVFSLHIRYQLDPVNRAAFCCLPWPDDRHVVFRLAGDHAGLTASTSV